MVDSASKFTAPNESEFRDSHPHEKDAAQNLDDLGSLDALPQDHSQEPIGNSKILDNAADINVDTPEEDDVLGDITLLEEAFAEMQEDEKLVAADEKPSEIALSDIVLSDDDNADQTPPDKNLLSENPSTDDYSDALELSIPVLNETIDEPTNEADEPASLDTPFSIPVLKQEATAFSESKSFHESLAIDAEIEKELAQTAEISGDSDSALEALLADDEDSAIRLAMAEDASVFAEPEDDSFSSISQFDQSATNFAEITSEFDTHSSLDAQSSSVFSKVSDSHIVHKSVDDKIAEMSHDKWRSNTTEVPAAQSVDRFERLSATKDVVPSLKADFTDDETHSSIISAFEADQPPSELSHAEHQVSVGKNEGFSINIPFELHTQLSRKIDALVIDATTSLTHELHDHLSDRLEILLAQAVESVLPSLVDQMVDGLRAEVKQRVKTQLPVIINEVLSKTSLKDK